MYTCHQLKPKFFKIILHLVSVFLLTISLNAYQADNSGPSITSLSPENGSSLDDRESWFTLTMSEPIAKGNGSIFFRGDRGREYKIDINSNEVILEGSAITFQAPNIQYDNYYIFLTKNALTDIAGNNIEGLFQTDTWRFDLKSGTGRPFVTNLDPPIDGYTAPDGLFQITFNETIRQKSGKIEFIKTSDQSLVASVDIPSSLVRTDVGHSGDIYYPARTASFRPESPLPVGEEILVKVSEGAFADYENNLVDDYFISNQWLVNVVEVPEVQSLTPNHNSQVARDANLKIAFTSPVRKGEGKIRIFRAANMALLQEIDVQSESVVVTGNEMVIYLSENLPNGVEVVVVPGDKTIKYGPYSFLEAFNSDTWHLTVEGDVGTISNIGISSLVPENGGELQTRTGEVRVTFDEAVTKGTGLIKFLQNGELVHSLNIQGSQVELRNNVLTVVPGSSLAYGSNYSIEFTENAIINSSGDVLGDYFQENVWTFDYTDGTAPPELIKVPKAIFKGNKLDMRFGEKIQLSEGSINIYRKSDNSLLQEISGIDGRVVSSRWLRVGLSSELPVGETLTLKLEDNVVRDYGANSYESEEGESWDFMIVDEVPVIESLSPADGGVFLAGSDIEVEFTSPIEASEGKIRIFRTDNLALLKVIDVDDPSVSIEGNRLRITTSEDLPTGKELSIVVASNALEYAQGLQLEGLFDLDTWNLTAVPSNSYGQYIESLQPNDEGEFIPGDQIQVGFNPNITLRKGNGKVRFYRKSDTRLLGVLDIQDQAVEVSANMVSIETPVTLPANEEYIVHFSADAIQNDTGGNIEDLFDEETWNLTSIEDLPPQISLLSPQNGEVVTPISQITVTFSEAVFKGEGKVRFYRKSNLQVLADLDIKDESVLVNNAIVSIQLPDGLPRDEELLVHFAGSTLHDQSGKDIQGLFGVETWNFTLVNEPLPSISSLSPNDGGTFIPGEVIQVSFNKPLSKGEGKLRFYRKSDLRLLKEVEIESSSIAINGETVSIVTPKSGLPYGQELIIHFSPRTLKDTSGNDIRGVFDIETWNLTAEEDSPPSIVSLSPVDGANTSSGSLISVTFSEPIFKNQGKLRIYRKSDLRLLHWLDINNSKISISNNVMSLRVPYGLPSGQELLVHLSKEALVDSNGNNIKGLFNSDTWNFTLASITPSAAAPVALPDSEDTPVNQGFGFKVYPNPTSGNVFINFSNNEMVKELILKDVFGNVVFAQNQDFKEENEITLSKLPNGIYFVFVQYDKGSESAKLMIRR